MKDSSVATLYKNFGKLVRQHRERLLPTMTQEKLAQIIGLSRTSITNIEMGRQHVSLHHIYAIADALGVHPDVFLPQVAVSGSAANAGRKLPLGIDKDIAGWAEKVVRAKT